MFGRGWEQARATVIAAQQMDDKPVYTRHGGGTLRRRHEYVLDVHPPDGAPVFRTTVLSPLNVDSMRDLSIGETVPVRYREKGRKVEFDTSDPSMAHGSGSAAQRARFDAIAHAAPGTGPADSPAAGSQRRRPDLSREALQRQRDKLRAEQPPPDASGDSSDRLEQLAKLADLRDRGVLSDAEFEAEKANILGES